MFRVFEYKTINNSIVDALLKIKGSKFYGLLYPVYSEEDIKSRLKECLRIYPQATHYCYAFRLGAEGEIYRVNDDGEPSGTAGLPIYNQLLSFELTNVLLVVVRYFGGTKLGVGGLIKAYKESAQHTIEQAEIIVEELKEQYELIFEYSYQSQVMTILKKMNIEVSFFDFSEKCRLSLELPIKNKTLFFEKFESLFIQKLVVIKRGNDN